MARVNRRGFLQASAVLPAAGLMSTGVASAQPAASAPAPDVTRILARYIVGGRYEDLPAPVRKEAVRSLVNYVGVTLGGSREDATAVAIKAFGPFSGPAKASLLGRKERFDILHAALINGIASHVLDFDDTHLKTIIHPAGPVVSALLALAEQQPISGREFLNAMILGVEAECRIGNSVYPQHYDIGWHITGTVGPFGAAAACGKVLGLDEQKMAWALSLAATQPVGLREMFGTMTKSFHPGRAAQNGLTAALMAQAGFTSSDKGIEALRGWANVLSTRHDYGQIVDNLGKSYEISLNTYKPFACGIVIHPVIDACIQLRNENKLTAAQIARIDLRVHPLVVELTGKTAPQSGLEGKFSVYHSAAAAIVEGAAGEQQYSDRAVRDPVVVGLRGKVHLTVDPAIHEEQARVTITLTDGRTLEKFIEHAVGSTQKPMSDAELEAKFRGLADGVLPPARTRTLLDLCWGVESLPDASAIARAARKA